MKKYFLLMGLVLGSSLALAQEGDAPISIEEFAAVHEAHLQDLRAGSVLATREMSVRERSNHIVRCVAYGVSAIVGVQTGVCHGNNGREYGMSVVGLGISGEIHGAYIKFKSSRPFGEHERLTGMRGAVYSGIGAETLDLHFSDGSVVSASGYGVGTGIAIEYVWLYLDEI